MDELQLAAAQTMEVVYGLFNNMKVVMDGTVTLLGMSFTVSKPFSLIDGKASIDNIREALSTVLP